MTNEEAFAYISGLINDLVSDGKYGTEREQALSAARIALSKRIAKQPGIDGTHYYCACCGQYWGKKRPYCYNCGQRTLWEDEQQTIMMDNLDNSKSNSDKDGDNNAKIN